MRTLDQIADHRDKGNPMFINPAAAVEAKVEQIKADLLRDVQIAVLEEFAKTIAARLAVLEAEKSSPMGVPV
jgi:hypothetical protein